MDSKTLNKIIKQLSDFNFVEAIYLFGSQVNGNPRKDSDIDLAVITKKTIEAQDLEIIGIGDEKYNISLFSKLPLVIQFRVFKEGKLLFFRDEKFIKNLKRKVILEYLDFLPFITNFYKRVLKH